MDNIPSKYLPRLFHKGPRGKFRLNIQHLSFIRGVRWKLEKLITALTRRYTVRVVISEPAFWFIRRSCLPVAWPLNFHSSHWSIPRLVSPIVGYGLQATKMSSFIWNLFDDKYSHWIFILILHFCDSVSNVHLLPIVYIIACLLPYRVYLNSRIIMEVMYFVAYQPGYVSGLWFTQSEPQHALVREL